MMNPWGPELPQTLDKRNMFWKSIGRVFIHVPSAGEVKMWSEGGREMTREKIKGLRIHPILYI